MSVSDLVVLGYISKAHGIGGEITLVCQVDSPELLLGDITLQIGEARQVVQVNSVRVHHGKILLRLLGVNTRSQAELLRGYTVLVPRDKFPPSPEEVYIHDLLGLAVECVNEPGSPCIGTLAAVDFPAGQELWAIQTPEGKEILFPAVPEFVVDIDLAAGRVRIAPPPGLLDLYR